MVSKYLDDKSIEVEAVGIVDGEYGFWTLWKDNKGSFYCSTEEGTNNVMKLSAVTCEEAVEETKGYIAELIKGWEE